MTHLDTEMSDFDVGIGHLDAGIWYFHVEVRRFDTGIWHFDAEMTHLDAETRQKQRVLDWSKAVAGRKGRPVKTVRVN